MIPRSFCGVNADAGDYGYPNRHISGTLERGHVRESIAFLKQLVPQFEQVCFIAKASPSGEALQKQVLAERDNYIVPVGEFYLINSIQELRRIGESADQSCGAVYMDSLEGVVDEEGRALTNREIISRFSSFYPGPTIGANRYHVEEGS
ncbi:hypothetical protein [Candidatus Reidiella endopervernicosa]|uniref:Uncharacterized protein n=1 Tax=Candidatus Reidiella endopervernicosa TaxID=2738883 RepID=A0A6N0HRS8_9GAMM|nr:hypothetical protein [Candidatus Reidiella endopervernicosa]QKQ24988.1 hypothetical protein HUE57_00825 [Candidatus Reidiella endopervernicosa]